MERVVRSLPYTLIVLALACITAGCASEPFSESGLKVDAPNGRIRVVDEGDHPVLLVESPQGIGSCVVTLQSGEWPGTVVARFAYNEDRPFTMMESISISNDDRVMTTHLGASAPVEVHSAPDGTGDGTKNYTTDFSVTETSGGIEVSFPMALLRGKKSFQVEWIDAFRG